MSEINNKQEQWVDDVLSSIDGMEKAQPSIALFDKIQSKLSNGEATILSISQWRAIAAAAIILIATNVYILTTQIETNNEMGDTNHSAELISNYNIYSE